MSVSKIVGKSLVIALSLFVFSNSYSQENPVERKYAEQILSADLKDYLTIIASDALEGRETGSRGQKMAATFISNHFEEIGLKPPVSGSYYQQVPLYSITAGTSSIHLSNHTFQNFQEFVYLGLRNINEEDGSIVFVGGGHDDVLDKLNIAGKNVLIITEKKLDEINLAKLKERRAKTVFVCNTSTDQVFKSFGSRAEQSFNSRRLTLAKPIASGNLENVVFVSPGVAEKIVNMPIEKLRDLSGGDAKVSRITRIKPSKINYTLTNNINQIFSPNVLGYLEGSDKKNELIVVTAHYDHIGISKGEQGDVINNGADDDGSGTVTVMELAKVFSKAKADGNGPRRSMLFMTVTAEEVGLLGSQYYTENPIFPIENTVVNLNIDMIGRTDPEHKDKDDYVYVIGSDKLSMELHELSETVNSTYTRLDFDYTYNDVNHPTNLYKRSDHWNFAKLNIPIIFYFDGIHEDYHQASDEVDKIEFDLLTKRAKLIFYTAWELANREGRIKPD